MSPFAVKRSATAFAYPNIKKPVLDTLIFLKRNSFKEARKQAVTTQLFMNVLLQFRNENI